MVEWSGFWWVEDGELRTKLTSWMKYQSDIWQLFEDDPFMWNLAKTLDSDQTLGYFGESKTLIQICYHSQIKKLILVILRKYYG